MKLKKIISFLSCMVLIILFFTACNEKIVVAYDKSTNTANISSSADFEWVDLNFKVTTKEFGEDYVTIKVRDIKENTIKKVNVITKYHKKDITIENIEYINYNTPINPFFIMCIISIYLTWLLIIFIYEVVLR
ncbi:MAG: hypothetical protein KBI16_00465 [Clostridia bacterium]|nr:hypothetical protein [Clostridia bacterium]